MSEEKKIIIDEDWKSQVQAEKEAAAKQTPGQPSTSVGGSDSLADEPTAAASAEQTTEQAAPASEEDPLMPPASIGMLMSSLATEALISMGQFPHPATGELTPRPNQAKYLIDTLAMLREKTTGNLTSEEAIALDDVLHQLRMAFVGSRE